MEASGFFYYQFKFTAVWQTAFASKPAPTGFCIDHTIKPHHRSLWERACPRRGHLQHHTFH
ncbi:hypothetical protein C1X65_01425 [Pseudomonas sp. FW305-70]|nr:hypothetical protein C1X65_01425 [Pseudomonas sp. FW305-70]